MSTLGLARFSTGFLMLLLALGGAYLFSPHATKSLVRLPRERLLGMVLSTLCWGWIAAELTLHPIDMIPFSATTILAICAICVPLSWVLLENLLCARAIGGLMMLWPMPVILAVREFVTPWRLVPVSIGYVSLTLGMIIVFHPWTFRVFCDKVVKHDTLRKGLATGMIILAILSGIAVCAFGKVVGE